MSIFGRMLVFIGLTLFSITVALNTIAAADTIRVTIDLKEVKNDKVRVAVHAPLPPGKESVFRFPKIIPGTYAIADYGRYVEGFTLSTATGEQIPYTRPDANTIVVPAANAPAGISYWVNDTYDTETSGDIFAADSKGIFSPAGSNILADSQFLLNLCAFVGYFDGYKDYPYEITIHHPKHLFGTTALADLDPAAGTDVFYCNNYAEVVDNPILYARPDTASFMVDSMKVLLGVYAPHKNTSAKKLLPKVEQTIRAQKKYLGKLNTTENYAVLVYLTAMAEDDAKGIGALEHNHSTCAVFREALSSADLANVIAHEFFHTVTPLKVHSEEIHNFNFATPVMSAHLWFYEGVTEYFAQLFQVNQGLVPENHFFDVMAAKEEAARQYNDTLSFTAMSKNILDGSMKEQYPNVYQKGPMMAMCLDIMLRERSGGKRGIEDLLYQLTRLYGPGHPFKDDELIPSIERLTSQETGDFLRRHAEQGEKIDYAFYLDKVGLKRQQVPIPELSVFMHGDQVYLDIDDEKKQVVITMPDSSNDFINKLGLQAGDVLLRINGLRFSAEDGTSAMMLGNGFQEGQQVTVDIIRKGRKRTLTGAAKLNYTDGPGYRFAKPEKQVLKDAWLRTPLTYETF